MPTKDHPVWCKIAVPTLDTLEEAILEIKEMEAKEEEARSQVLPPTDSLDNDNASLIEFFYRVFLFPIRLK